MKSIIQSILSLSFVAITNLALADALNAPSAPTDITKQKNAEVLQALPFSNTEDFTSTQKDLENKPDSLVIRSADGHIVWDMDRYIAFEADGKPAPDSVNPSLWRQAQLNNTYGLFKVTDKIHQVRGYDLSVMSIIEGDTGYIILDPLTTEETAKAAIELVYEKLGKKPIIAVIYSHSHLDHFGGVKGVVSQEDVDNKKVKIIAPVNFINEAVGENVMAGNAMSRRAMYMYGGLLPANAQSQVDSGLGKMAAFGLPTLILPTDYITETGQQMTIDGIDFVFQYTPDTEAPTEMNFFLPQFNALCMAENATHTMHNLYTLRGAKVRDAKVWAEDLHETIELFGDKTQVIFASHHWPTWGNEQSINFLKKQRDMYKYLHDQTLRLANQGYTMTEIAEMVQLPKSLDSEWYNRGYYGSVSQNVKAVYQRYLGWFDGNPANLNPLPPVETSKNTVEYMGGEDVILEKAQKDFTAGNYRWVAQVVNHVVFANPDNQKAKDLLASAYEQLGYQSENGTWRNFYLTGAMELRNGVKPMPIVSSASPDIIQAMPLNLFFDYLAIKVNGPAAEGKKITLNIIFPDINEKYLLELNNSVLNYSQNKTDDKADATITLDRKVLDQLASKKVSIMDVKDNIKVEGDKSKVQEFFALQDEFNLWFNIVTP
ncbi:MAG: alkyl/aryl-sulfatase [Gammaproteobacteria bacterium]